MKSQHKSMVAGVAILLAPMLMSTTAVAAETLLTNKAGMTLYTFDKDSQGVSNCYDGCAVKWPPYMASKNAKVDDGFGVIKRKDGAEQWTYHGQPLYTWMGDKKKGDTNGDGLGGVWHVVKKAGYSY